MKQILGDNQFFGINHNDLEKGDQTKRQFSEDGAIYDFIIEATELGLDGFVLNSNDRGFKIIRDRTFPEHLEIHYSIPYPHKFANMVNEAGMMQLFNYAFKQTSFKTVSSKTLRFVITRDVKYLTSIINDLEIPKSLHKNSFVYLQNIVTDLVIGIGRKDLLLEFCKAIQDKGYRPGLITLNPTLLEKIIEEEFPDSIKKDLVVCFNINKTGFNVFPSREEVETFIKRPKAYQLMGMSVLSSGGTHSIKESLKYVKDLGIDYVVYGSSKLKNIQSNIDALKV